MKTTVKKLSDSRVEIKVTLDAKDLKPAKEKALEKLAKEIHVEGFRKGWGGVFKKFFILFNLIISLLRNSIVIGVHCCFILS